MENEKYLRSVNLRQDTAFPYLAAEVTAERSEPWTRGFHLLHRHEDLQFTYAAAGAVELTTLFGALTVPEGTAVMVNSGVVHVSRTAPGGRYYNFIFPPKFLDFYPGSPAAEENSRLIGSEALPLLALDGGEDWHAAALAQLRALAGMRAAGREPPREVLLRLNALWFYIIENTPLPAAADRSPAAERMRRFLDHIAAHYGEELTLGGIAASAHVSASECLRCFRETLGVSPYQYLTEYRVWAAAELLRTTALPVGQIAERVGFRQQSNFAKHFKQKTGRTPRDYRETEG